jgi:hypothetical protein
VKRCFASTRNPNFVDRAAAGVALVLAAISRVAWWWLGGTRRVGRAEEGGGCSGE